MPLIISILDQELLDSIYQEPKMFPLIYVVPGTFSVTAWDFITETRATFQYQKYYGFLPVGTRNINTHLSTSQLLEPRTREKNGTWIKGQHDQLNETIENTQIHQRLLN